MNTMYIYMLHYTAENAQVCYELWHLSMCYISKINTASMMSFILDNKEEIKYKIRRRKDFGCRDKTISFFSTCSYIQNHFRMSVYKLQTAGLGCRQEG